MDEKRKKRKSKPKSSSSFLRDWGAFLFVIIAAAGISLWSERHWATAWLSYLPPITWAIPIIISWAWPMIFRHKVKWGNVGAQVLFFVLILGFRVPLFAQFDRSEPSIRIGSLNTERGAAKPAMIAAWAEREKLDVICFQEANAIRDDYWAQVKQAMPGWTLVLRREVGVLTKIPVQSSSSHPAPSLDREIQVVRLAANPPVTIVNNHWPALPMRITKSGVIDFEYWMNEREKFCVQLEKVVRQQSGPVIVAGDFNTPLNAGLFDRIQGLGSHAHRSVGWGFAWSYPSKFPVTAIDHIVVRGGKPVSFEVGPNLGSDHRPVSAGIHLKR